MGAPCRGISSCCWAKLLSCLQASIFDTNQNCLSWIEESANSHGHLNAAGFKRQSLGLSGTGCSVLEGVCSVPIVMQEGIRSSCWLELWNAPNAHPSPCVATSFGHTDFVIKTCFGCCHILCKKFGAHLGTCQDPSDRGQLWAWLHASPLGAVDRLRIVP